MSSAKPIYDRSPVESSKRRMGVWILLGAVSGAATWLFLQEFGIPQIFGIGSDAGLIPLVVLGGMLAFSRMRLVAPLVSVALLILMIAVAHTNLVVPLVRDLIRSDRLPSHADVVVALSGGVTADGHLTQQSMDRALTAAELVNRGVAPVLLFTREERKSSNHEANNAADQVMIAHLARLGRVITTRRAKSTHDEAVSVAGIAQHRGWRSIILVTSPLHSRRACATFEHAGVKVTCAPSVSRDVAVNRLIYPHDRVVAFGLWLYETAGTLRYKQRGWL